MNVTEMTLVSIITSATLATTMMNTNNQFDKVHSQQEQARCMQKTFDSLTVINPNDNSMYEYARSLNTEQSPESIQQNNCNLQLQEQNTDEQQLDEQQ